MGSRKFQTPLVVRIIVRPALAVLASIMVANDIMESVTSDSTLRTTNDCVNKKRLVPKAHHVQGTPPMPSLVPTRVGMDPRVLAVGTLGPLGLSSSSGRTPDFRSGNRSSILRGSTNHSLPPGPLLLWGDGVPHHCSGGR